MRQARLVIAAACCMASALPLCSEILTQDLQIAARALSFMERPLTGVVHAGIVYSAKDQRSVRQADELQRMLGRSARFGNLELRAVRVEIGEVARAKVDVLLLTDYIGDADARRADLSGTRSVPCVTTDIQQVRDGVCMMGIRSTPKVEILINRAAAAKSGVKFATVFRMLITEL